MKKKEDYNDEEEVESLISSPSRSVSGEARSLLKSSRKLKMYAGFLALVLVVVVASVAFLFSAGEEAPNSTTLGEQSKFAATETNKESKNDDHEAIAAKQIENFRNGRGLMINVHITHHGKGASLLDR